ncbi:MAG: CPBP family glutamic-type intramembrane protease [Anaerosomatales bacterium]|nr:CPBP family glutamic-type intramembrane protease [Anaerosomatales bacterium]
MASTRIPLSLDPSRCDRCGRCTTACAAGALRVGATYIYVDWKSCDGCLECAKVCDAGAITGRGAPEAPAVPERRPATVSAPPTVRPTASAPEWTLLEAWALLAALIAAFLGKDALLTSDALLGLPGDTQVFARVAVLFSFYAIQAALLWLLAWRRGLSVLDAYRLRAADVPWNARLASAGLVVGLLVAVRLGAWGYGAFAQEMGWTPPAREVGDLTEIFGPTVWGLLLSVVLVVIVAPLVEEVVFRGVLQGAFAGRVDWRIAIALSAALFALYHFTPWLFLPLFALGAACGWLAHTRRSLLPAISLHGAYNVLPVVIAFWMVW